MFIDRVKLKLVAGKGGNGIVAWRREKFLPKGGPYGGNGGVGGDISLQADVNIYSLEAYRHRRLLKAQNGQPGGVNLRQGKSGSPLVLKVPCGTLVKDKETGEVLYDLTESGEKWMVCQGGRGGKGNHCFKSSTNRAPNYCTPGKPGIEREVELELKLIADIGLVGMPNAGKSTLMSRITHAKVKIGAYPFTTLTPNLSFIQCEDFSRILIADIPGIIENAHLNRGLGLEFLRHIERSSSLLFILDAGGEDESRNPFQDFMTLREELGSYSSEMLEKSFLVVLNKMDQEKAAAHIAEFMEKYPFDPNTVFSISAKEEKGLEAVIEAMRCLTTAPTSPREDTTAHHHQAST